MGLLDRLRPARPADRTSSPSDAAPTTSAPPSSASSAEDVITASDLWHVADWQRVPPIAPILEEPEWVHSHHFEDSLTTWQPPERFLGELGHAVTDTAPSGLVEGLTVLAPAPQPQPEPLHTVPSSESLPLAVPPAPAKAEPQPVRRQPWAWDYEEQEEPASTVVPVEPPAPVSPVSPVELPPVAEEPAAAAPEPTPAEPPPLSSGLVSAAPLQPVVQRLVSADSGPSRFTHAPTPPDMPLVQLPSSPLPPELRETRWEARTEAAPEPPAGLVGSEPLTERPEPQIAAPTPEVPPAVHPSSADLPLASPPESPGSIEPPASIESPESFESPALPESPAEPTAPLIGAAEPLATDTQTPESHDEAPPLPDDSIEPLPLAQPPAPRDADAPIAPLVSQSTPLAPEQQALTSADEETEHPIPAPPEPASEPDRPLARPAGVRRSGLGAPLAGLPPTAARWDITKMSPPEQMRMVRSMVRGPSMPRMGDLGAPPLPLAAEPAPLAFPAAPEPVYAGTPLPLVPIEDYPTARPEPLVSDEAESPILPMAPILSPEAEAPTSVQRSTPASEGAQVRATIGRRHGLDLSTVPVDRSDRAASQAKQMGARAFTSQSGVSIPSHLGSLDTGEGEASLAHELTHVAQRTRYGTSLPSEDSREGQRLEAEARTAEMIYAPPAAGRPTPIQPLQDVAPPADGSNLPLAGRASGPNEDALAESIFQRLSSLSSPAPAQMEPTVMTSPFFPSPPAMGIQRQTDTETPTTTDSDTTSTPSTPKKSDAKDGPFGKRPSDNELANLSYWLYPLISHKLKGELREGRERLGMITDHYRRW